MPAAMSQLLRPVALVLAALFAPLAVRAADLAVTQLSGPLEVEPGGTVTLVVQTEPGARCEGRRQGHNGNAYSILLGQQTAGLDGRASWQWDVLPGHNPVGKRGMRVTCRKDNRQATLETEFVVK